MATAVLLGVTGVSRAPALVLDIQSKYFDRLLLTPVRRTAILLGHMMAGHCHHAGPDDSNPDTWFHSWSRFHGGPIGVVGFIVLMPFGV